MSWSWSHTNEAYEIARINLAGMARKKLEIIWAEWQAYTNRVDDPGAFNEEKYKAALKVAKKAPVECLINEIWEKASELATCTNGGWEAWMCPFGCGCHMVPFSPNFGLVRNANKRGYPES